MPRRSSYAPRRGFADVARDEVYGFSLVEEVAKLRQRIHDEVMPRLRALELRDDHQAEHLERLSRTLEGIADQVSAMAHQDEIARAVVEALGDRDRTWHQRLALPYRILIGAAAGVGALVVIVSAVWQFIDLIGG